MLPDLIHPSTALSPSFPFLWDTLALESRPIYLYGTGDGADKILDVMAQKHIPAAGIFVSEEFYRGQSFRGYAVTTLSQLEKQYSPDGFVVLIAFGSHLPDMIRRVKAIASLHPTFIPDVPVAGGFLFDRDFYLDHLSEIQKARSLFADEQSLFVFDKILEYKLTGLPGPLFDCVTSKAEVFGSLLPLGRGPKKESYLDLGAYSGDTIFEFLKAVSGFDTSLSGGSDTSLSDGSDTPLSDGSDTPLSDGSDTSLSGGSYASITAFEPDEGTFRKLRKNTEGLPNLTLYHGAAGVETGILEMTVSRGRGTRISSLSSGVDAGNGPALKPLPGAQTAGKTRQVPCFRIDDLNLSPTYVKIDVEGAEKDALLGMEDTLRRCQSALNIALYHRSEDLFELPLLLHKWLPDHQFFLRRHDCFPCWEVNLYASGKEP